MIHGVIINEGPQSWQIIQQSQGYAEVNLSGTYSTLGVVDSCKVYARIVKEENYETVISWQECKISEISKSEGTWNITLKNIPCGGLYRLETCLNQNNEPVEWSRRGDMIHHIGVGDIYVIAGQSNSAGYGRDMAYDAPDLGVHLLRNNGKWDLASHPFNESTGTIHEENMEAANPGSSPYLQFGKILKEALGYPIGFLQTALGGSPLSSWNPDENGYLYKTMLDVIKGQGSQIKGVLWYQGESDANKALADSYLERFENMVETLRKDISNPSLPFMTVQLNRCIGVASEDDNISWGKIRETQRQAANKIKNVFVVPATDASLSDGIHNSSPGNIVIGERLAKLALEGIYCKGKNSKAPEIVKARLSEENSVILEFTNVFCRLDLKGANPYELPFVVADNEGEKNITAYEIIENNKIKLILDNDIKGNAYVHGAYQKNLEGVLLVDIGTYLPMLSFYGLEVLKG